MVNKCCVPNCRGNYRNGPKARCYSFPKDEQLRNKWIWAINRQDFTPTIYTKVCDIHFAENDFQIYTSNKTNGVKLDRPRLKPTAVPSIFPNRQPADDNKSESVQNHNDDDNKFLRLALRKTCFCCGNDDRELVSMLKPQYCGENPEVYATMVMECFGIDIINGIEDVCKNLYVLCKPCIVHLRNAYYFKSQIRNAYNRIKGIIGISDVPNDSIISNIKKETDLDVIHDSDQIENIETDEKSFLDEALFKCNICKAYYTTDVELQNHMAAHFPNFVCYMCKEIFASDRELHMHALQHIESIGVLNENHNTKSKLAQCDICQKSFTTSSSLSTHIKSHLNIKDYVCHVCEKGFVSSSRLKRHMDTHRGIKDVPCEVCGKWLTSQYGLKVHMKIHDPIRDFICDYCNKGCITKTELQRHMLSHMGVRDFHCTLCSKAFILKKHLTQHMSTHTDVKKFICDHCNKGYKSKFGLIQHIYSSHNGNFEAKKNEMKERNMCNYCGKIFLYKSVLKKHVFFHLGINSQSCDKSFSNKLSMKL